MYYDYVNLYCFYFSFLHRKPIAPNEEFRETIQIKPRRPGRREIIANFHCKQLCDVTGVTEVEISGESTKS